MCVLQVFELSSMLSKRGREGWTKSENVSEQMNCSRLCEKLKYLLKLRHVPPRHAAVELEPGKVVCVSVKIW